MRLQGDVCLNLTMKDKLQPTKSVLTMYQVLYNPNILTLQCPYRNQSNNSTIKNTITIIFYLFKETFLLNHIRNKHCIEFPGHIRHEGKH